GLGARVVGGIPAQDFADAPCEFHVGLSRIEVGETISRPRQGSRKPRLPCREAGCRRVPMEVFQRWGGRRAKWASRRATEAVVAGAPPVHSELGMRVPLRSRKR